MKKKKQEIRIHLDMSLQQAQIISEAVEEYMRLRMYQFSDLADVLARRNFQYDQSDPQCGEKFKAYMQRRDEITELFEQIRRVALDGAECADRSEDADIAGDLWSVLRHEIYKAKGGDPATGAYDSYPAIQLAREPLAKCWFTAGIKVFLVDPALKGHLALRLQLVVELLDDLVALGAGVTEHPLHIVHEVEHLTGRAGRGRRCFHQAFSSP